MPFIVPALIAGGFAAAGAAAGAGVAAFLQAFVVTAVVVAVSTALTKKPRNPNPVTQTGGGAITVRQPIAPWQVIVGRARAGAILTFRYISTDRKYWHMVLTFACHRCESVEEVWFNDERLTIDPSTGNVFGKYSKEALVSKTETFTVPGSPHQVTTAQSVAGIHDVFLVSGIRFPLRLIDVSPAAPAKFDEFSRSANTFTFHSSNQGRGVRIRYYTATPTGGAWARIKVSLGDEGPAVQPFPDLVAESGGTWTNDHKQYGHTKLYIRLEANNDVFAAGVPQVTVVVRGARIYDTRTALTAYSNNAALWLSHYLTDQDYGLAADRATEIHDDDLVSAANSSDDAITIADGGAEKRYTVNGVFLTSEQPKAVLERLLAACAGTLVNLGDRWHINVGVYHPPAVTLEEKHLAGANVVTPMLASRDDGNVNGVKGVFTNPRSNWQPDDFPALPSDTYLADDNNERRWKDLDLTAFVTSITQAQRLAKIDLLRLRQGLTETATFKIPAWQVVPGRSVARTDAQLGWSAKAFEVLESELAFVEEGDGVTIQTRLTLQETAAAVYDWSTSEEQLEDFAPNTTLPTADVPAPGAPVVQEEILEAYDGRSVATKAIVSWVASIYPFGPRYQLEYKLTSAPLYTVLSVTQATTVEIPDIAPGTYDFRVKALGNLGNSSGYSAIVKEIVGLTAEPANVSGFFVTVHEGRARCHLDLTLDLDVKLGGRVWLRWSTLTVGATWNDGSLIKSDGYPGDSIVCEAPLYPGTYMAKFEDSTGHLSRTEASFIVTEALLSGFTTLSTVTYHPAFDGTKASVAVLDGALQLAGTTLWDSMVGTMDDQDRIDSLGGIASSGSCTFTTKMDLGSVQTVRLFPHVKTLAFDTGDLWDSRTELMDDWGLVDGAVIEDAEIQVQVRITNDDPNGGSPTWGPWHNLEVADYTARGFEFRTLHTSGNVTHNRRLFELSVAAKQLT